MNNVMNYVAMALDPVALMRAVGENPRQWQEEMLRSRADRILLNCCRGAGKTTAAAYLALWTALFTPGEDVVVLSSSMRQAKQLLRIARNAYRAIGEPLEAGEDNKLTLELKNGSRILVLPNTRGTGRGFHPILLIVDEAAQIDDENFFALTPGVGSTGRIVIMSTPYGRRGFFYEAWKDRVAQRWQPFEILGTQLPENTREWLDEELARMGQWSFDQEYMCRFVDTETSAFRTEDIDAMASEEVEWWDDALSSAWT